ncbi:MAG: hypothetical protein CO109_09025 [Deltaproteobacteria bacterium CG_4_9_14_3_um_filter_65_9]|nr:MAG: hypothetical protein CO109_09025 [Deltaproteobacteria bacterium CG_4_9_14_3_um_filter_65_9]
MPPSRPPGPPLCATASARGWFATGRAAASGCRRLPPPPPGPWPIWPAPKPPCWRLARPRCSCCARASWRLTRRWRRAATAWSIRW